METGQSPAVDLDQLGLALRAVVLRARATVAEAAAAGSLPRRRCGAGDGLEADGSGAAQRRRKAAQEAEGVRVPRAREQLGRSCALHDPPRVQDGDPRAEAGRGAQVVGREQDGYAALLPEAAEQIEDARLPDRIQGAGRVARAEGPRPAGR